MGLFSTIALFIPIFLILVLRLANHRTFPLLLIYYAAVFIYNLLSEGYIAADKEFINSWGLTNNLLDIPLMLGFLTYFSPSKTITKTMRILIVSFISFEILVLAINGFNVGTITIILGPGLLLVFIFSITFFTRYGKLAIETGKTVGKTLMASALIFAYGTYAIIYALFYILRTEFVADTFLIYFMSTIISSAMLSIGLYHESIRVKKLRELLITRKELHEIYKDTKMTAPSRRTVMLDFDVSHLD
jgi:hypothetical protein